MPFVGFAEILPPLAVADQRPLAARGLQHAGGNFAGVGAFGGPEKILASDLNACPMGGVGRGLKTDERWTNHDLAVLGACNQRVELLKKSAGFLDSLVHL